MIRRPDVERPSRRCCPPPVPSDPWISLRGRLALIRGPATPPLLQPCARAGRSVADDMRPCGMACGVEIELAFGQIAKTRRSVKRYPVAGSRRRCELLIPLITAKRTASVGLGTRHAVQARQHVIAPKARACRDGTLFLKGIMAAFQLKLGYRWPRRQVEGSAVMCPNGALVIRCSRCNGDRPRPRVRPGANPIAAIKVRPMMLHRDRSAGA